MLVSIISESRGELPQLRPEVKGFSTRFRSVVLADFEPAVIGQSMILEGDPEITVNLKRSVRACRMTLRVSRLDGRVTLSMPKRVPEREAFAFARQKEDWIRRQLSLQPHRVDVVPGVDLPIEGRPHRVVEADGALRIEADRLILPMRRAAPGRRIEAFLKHNARNRISGQVDHYAAQVGKPVHRITLRDTRSRWGSCSQDGRLMFSWRLILAPPEVLSYVVAHEVAHLVEMNHSKAFWQVVERIYPDWRTQRDWLRQHGPELHRYRFGR